MSTQSTTRCEYCGRTEEAVSTRRGRGAQSLCDACDAWISDRMREMTVAVPDTPASNDREGDADADAGRVLALDPALDVDVALEFAVGVSYETIGQLEAAGFETVDDLWTADRDDLLAVPHVEPADVDAIVRTISTHPDRDLDDVLEDIPDLSRRDGDDDRDAERDGGDSSGDGDPSDDDAEIL